MPIDKKILLDKKILSVDADDDDGVDIKSFTLFVQENTNRNKNSTANQFSELGEDLLGEIEEKKQRKEIEKQKFIPYILKHDKKYSQRQLNSYSFEDIKEIYNETRNSRPLRKALRFIFNL
jgi:RNA:NAD 2'-phosphotransferase (TPT1/KptA family)